MRDLGRLMDCIDRNRRKGKKGSAGVSAGMYMYVGALHIRIYVGMNIFRLDGMW